MLLEWVRGKLFVCFNEITNNIPDFAMNGDLVRGGFIEDLASLLDQGVKVALINGDRDFRCNCKEPTLTSPFLDGD